MSPSRNDQNCVQTLPSQGGILVGEVQLSGQFSMQGLTRKIRFVAGVSYLVLQSACMHRSAPPPARGSERAGPPAPVTSAAPTIKTPSSLDLSGASATVPRVVSLALGTVHSCALINTGEVRCWGRFAGKARWDGQNENLGDYETPASAEPVAIGGKAIQISAGGDNTCALLESGAVRCWHWRPTWGSQPGEINAKWRKPPTPEPLKDVNIGSKAVQVSVGSENLVCALLESGSLSCWGWGRLGFGGNPISAEKKLTATEDVPVGGKVSQVAAGYAHICVLLGSSKVRCWGAVSGDEYRREDKIPEALPVLGSQIVDVGSQVTQLSSGGFNCVLLAQRTVRCWGDNSFGQLGYGHKKPATNSAIADDVQIGGKVVQIATGHRHACALLDSGHVRCWGVNAEAQLGYGHKINIGDDGTPQDAGDVDIGGKVVQIAAGGAHNCALLDTGRVRCWGLGVFGQLGYGNSESVGDDETPASAGDVQILPGDPVSKPNLRQPQVGAQRPSEMAAVAPFVWQKRGPQRPDLQPCQPDCAGCKTLSNSALFYRRTRKVGHRQLIATERAHLRHAYAQYLTAPGCSERDGTPKMDPAAIGKAGDTGRILDVLDGSFTAKGAKQTIVLFSAGFCGAYRNDVPGTGQQLLILMEGKQLLGTTVEGMADHLAAVDLEEDGISEVIVSGSDRTVFAMETHRIDVYSYGSGQQRLVAYFQTNSNSCDDVYCGSIWDTSVLYRYSPSDQSLCFEAQDRQRDCPWGHRKKTTNSCGL